MKTIACLSLLLLSGCSQDAITEAEAFANSRGVVLTGKTENTRAGLSERAFDYKTKGGSVVIQEFKTEQSAEEVTGVAKKLGAMGSLMHDLREGGKEETKSLMVRHGRCTISITAPASTADAIKKSLQ